MGFGGDGLPLSLQLAGAPGTDFALAAVADAYQRSDDRHLRRPPEPDHGATPAAVAVPQGAPGKPETVQWLATSLRELGLSIDESEIVEFAGQWELTSMLFGFLPDLPA
ncbi:hypothetical protein GCM10020000_52600 [Streptomyces olivoverticillatus]